jgi:hypothetical protein
MTMISFSGNFILESLIVYLIKSTGSDINKVFSSYLLVYIEDY